MELYTETLAEYMASRKAEECVGKEYDRRLSFASQIVEGLYTLHHGHRLIHGNLSLRSVYLGGDGRVKIGDFGFATKCRHLIPVLASPCVSPTKKAAKGGEDVPPVILGPEAFPDSTPSLLAPPSSTESYGKKVSPSVWSNPGIVGHLLSGHDIPGAFPEEVQHRDHAPGVPEGVSRDGGPDPADDQPRPRPASRY